MRCPMETHAATQRHALAPAAHTRMTSVVSLLVIAARVTHGCFASCTSAHELLDYLFPLFALFIL